MRRHRRSAVGNTWARWGSIPVVFFPGMAGHPCPTLSHPTCDVPFPPRRTGEYRKGMISARPSYQGVRRYQEIGLGSRNLERADR
jgi:hypothetical protein